ncbi:MAG: aminopeptidase [Bacillota bacterium]
MTEFAARLDQYAALLVRVGINLQPGQEVMVSGTLEHADLVRRVVEKSYDAGARRVHVRWEDPQVTRMTMARADAGALAEYPVHLARWDEEILAGGGAYISIVGSDPKLLAGIDPARIASASQAAARARQGVNAYISSLKASWVVGAAPTKGWADLVVADRPEGERVDALWDYILQACRVTGEGDPVQAWQVHLGRLNDRTEYLNRMRFARLHFRAPGTDLTVDLPAGHLWVAGGAARNAQGTPFCPNLPTEEVFTAPLRDGVNGTVRSTLPLNKGGSLITGMTLRFERGRVVAYSAEQGEAVLKGILETDEGASYLGEVALVPVSSPIYRTGVLFYNTLFDENASSHLALGRAYPFNLEGGVAMSAEQQRAAGLNYSHEHVDFMIGSPELDVDGETAAGERVPLFRKGLWV